MVLQRDESELMLSVKMNTPQRVSGAAASAARPLSAVMTSGICVYRRRLSRYGLPAYALFRARKVHGWMLQPESDSG